MSREVQLHTRALLAALLSPQGAAMILGDGDYNELPGPRGPARKVKTGDTRCSCCGEHAADGRQYDNQGNDDPVCNLCAAPGQELRPLEDS
jgi:hypothetical protein